MGMPVPDAQNGGWMDVILSRQRDACTPRAKSTLEDAESVLWRETMTSAFAVPLYILDIARFGCVFEIDETIVAWDSVQMPCVQPRGARTNKGQHNERVNFRIIVFAAYVDYAMTARIKGWTQYLSVGKIRRRVAPHAV